MILYIDSLFAEGRNRVARPLHEIPDTLSRLYLLAMREHDRRAVFLQWANGQCVETPDWRLDRHVIRLGLYLRERVGIKPGDRVAILSPLRQEWLVADLAVIVPGAISVALDDAWPDSALAAALAEAAPRVIFVSGPAGLERLARVREGTLSLELVIAFDGPVPPGRAALLSEVLDLGGTLDTPERAQSFRVQAREVDPNAPALAHLDQVADGRYAWKSLTHAEVIGRLKSLWFEQPAHKGDVAYVAGPGVTLDARLALYAFVGDGYSTTALATAARESDELMALRPHKIVAPPAVLEHAVRQEPACPKPESIGVRKWLSRAARLIPFGGGRRNHRAIRKVLGGRARWIRPTAPVDAAVATQLREVVAVRTEV